jgi:hypothetical protein
VGSAPIGTALFIPADQDAKANAGFTVALFAKLMEADDLYLHVLRMSGGATSAVVAEIPTAIAIAAIKGFKIMLSPVQMPAPAKPMA